MANGRDTSISGASERVKARVRRASNFAFYVRRIFAGALLTNAKLYRHSSAVEIGNNFSRQGIAYSERAGSANGKWFRGEEEQLSERNPRREVRSTAPLAPSKADLHLISPKNVRRGFPDFRGKARRRGRWHRGRTIKGATSLSAVGRRASRGPASVDTRVGTRRAEKSTGTGKPGGYRGRRAARTPIFHEVVTPDGLSLSGFSTRVAAASHQSSLWGRLQALPPPATPPLSLSLSGPQKKAFCRSGLAVRSNVSRSTVQPTARGCAASGRYT